MTTAADLIKNAALKLGAVQPGESLNASEASDCLNVLNSMLDLWAVDNLLVYQIVQANYSWAGGNASRTIGSGGNFSGARPHRIEDGTFWRDVNNVDVQAHILRSRAQYDALPDKTGQSTVPQYLFYDQAYPLGVLYAYPVPSAAITLYLNYWQTLQSFTALTTALSLPPGYQWMIEHNLAVQLEPIFGIPAPARVAMEADRSRRIVARANHIPVLGGTETLLALNSSHRSSNIFTDT